MKAFAWQSFIFVTIAICCDPHAVRAGVIYCGVGNDDFAGDVDEALAAIKPCLTKPGDKGSFVKEQTGDQIKEKLEAAAKACKPGDIFIFHYAGHGNIVDDQAPLDENGLNDATNDTNKKDGLIGKLSELEKDKGLRDDTFADCIDLFPKCCAILVVLDSCFSGEFITGNDLNRPSIMNRGGLAFIGTADENHCAPGVSIFLPLWKDAFTKQGDTLKGDTNRDGKLTMEELYSKLLGVNDKGGTSANYLDVKHANYVVWSATPEPSSFLLASFGLLALVGYVRYRKSPVAA